jgi:hypothetical protein
MVPVKVMITGRLYLKREAFVLKKTTRNNEENRGEW